MASGTSGFWSERIMFGLLIIVGYLTLLILSLVFPALVAIFVSQPKLVVVMPAISAGSGTLRDGLLVIGPLLGLIVQAIWKVDKADKDNAASLATLSTAAAATLASTAPQPAPTAAPIPDAPGWITGQ